MHFGENVNPPAFGLHDNTCPFCAGTKPELKHFHTKNGERKDETELEKNLAAKGEVTSDPEVGAVYPTDGGGDPNAGWVVEAGYLEDFPVTLQAAAHHLIPGRPGMKESRLEKWTWTGAPGSQLTEDIGYNIDGAENGVWLPHLPHIYFTRKIPGTDPKRPTFAEYYGVAWGDSLVKKGKGVQLSEDAKLQIGLFIMLELWLQMHFTEHGARYKYLDNKTTYDGEARQRCNLLADLMLSFWSQKCQEAPRDDGTLNPPYGLVERINLQSKYILERITGRPDRWQSWVGTLAQEVWQFLRTTESAKLTSKGAIRRI